MIFLIPASELVIQIAQYVLSKAVKPTLIPKLDFTSGIDEENSTFVIIPTIIKSKEKVKDMMKNLEIYYLANKSPNLYFALLGDCSQSNSEEEEFDEEVIEEGLNQIEILNKKYANDDIPIFSFIYRKRSWNEKEGCYLGWERKRGLINQFNEYILGNQGNQFRINTLEKYKEDEKVQEKLRKIKYIITLDADTDLVLNSALELVGAMAHILNRPVIDEEKNIVVDGYGILQPRVGINLDICYKTIFTKIFAGAGGTDNYTNAISDIYQDNFKEGIFTGKGIYDLQVFSKILKKAIPENTVLSHDLLEGSYLRCGLATDIMLMDGYPTKYTSFMNRLSRWIRGDWQIVRWLGQKSPLNLLSKYKIFDNLRRSLFDISIIISLIYLYILKNVYTIKVGKIMAIIIVIYLIPFLLDILNYLIGKREGEEKQKTFTPQITGIKAIILRMIITLGCLPYKAYISIKAILKTIYRLNISKKHLLEWTTSEEAEKLAKTDVISYYKNMFINVIFGIVCILIYIKTLKLSSLLLGILWIFVPLYMCYISKEKEELPKLQEKAKKSGNPQDAQELNDFIALCNRFEKKIHDLELTKMISLQMAPQIRLIQNNDTLMSEKIQSTIINTIPLWKSQIVLSLGVAHAADAAKVQREVTDMTNELLRKNAEILKTSTIETAKESERGIVDIETLRATNESLISTLDEILNIQTEGREKRREAEIELRNIEDQLKNKLLDFKY